MIPFRPLLPLVALLVFAAACRGPQPAPAAPVTHATIPLPDRMPASAAGFTHGGGESIANGGTIFRFRDTSSVLLSVILYPADAVTRGAAPAQAALLAEEGKRFAEVMDLQARRGFYRSYRLVGAAMDTVPTVAAVAPGHTSIAFADLRGRPVVEYQRLFLLDTTFVKVRATVPQAQWPRRDVDELTAVILGALAGRPGS